MYLQPHVICCLTFPWLIGISSSGLNQRQWALGIAILSLVSTCTYIHTCIVVQTTKLLPLVCIIPIENGITASVFLRCDAEDFDDIGLTKFGKKRILKTFTEVKGMDNHSQVNEIYVSCPLVIHTQANSHQKETILMRGRGIKYPVSILRKRMEKMTSQSMVCTMHVFLVLLQDSLVPQA
jgi:hypothetical protein